MTTQTGSAARVPRQVSVFSPILKALFAAGVPLGLNGLITIPGRKSGLPRTTPVAIMPVAGRRWVWAPWGEVHWVRNLRAAGRATITVRGRTEDVTATELNPTQRVGFFRDVLGPVARASRSESASSASSTGSISTIRWAPPTVASCSSSTHIHRGGGHRRRRAPRPPRMSAIRQRPPVPIAAVPSMNWRRSSRNRTMIGSVARAEPARSRSYCALYWLTIDASPTASGILS